MRANHIYVTHLTLHFVLTLLFLSKSIMQFRRHNIRWEFQTDTFS